VACGFDPILPAVNTQQFDQSKRGRFGIKYLAIQPCLYSNQDHGRVVFLLYRDATCLFF